MSRRLRYLPRQMLVEVTARTLQGRFLLKPSPRLNRRAIGVLARAQSKYDMRVHAVCVMSNHYHLLLSPRDSLQLARFMNFVQSNLAREAGRLKNNWNARFWARRYQAILVSDEPTAQLSRLRYLLSQGCKEGLVSRPEEWQGANCVRQLLSGETKIRGEWIDRTALYRHRGSRRSNDESAFTTTETLELSPLPCFEGLEVTAQCEWVRDCIEEIALEARSATTARRGRTRGNSAKQDDVGPHGMKRTPAPWFHASSAIRTRELKEAYALFVAMYRSAAEKLKKGLEAIFPGGSFPPSRPYVPV